MRFIAASLLLLSLQAACVAYTPPDYLTPSPIAPTATRPLTAPLDLTPTPGPTATSAPPPVPVECLIARPRAGATPQPAELQGQGPRIVAATNVPPLQRFTPPPLVPDPSLERKLLEALGPEAASYAYYVKDLRSNRGAVFDADKVFYSASLFKLFVMLEVFHQVEANILGLDETLVISPYYDSFGLGPRSTELCQALTVQQALQAMMSISDNAAAVLLQDLAGAGNINNALAGLGLRQSRLLADDLPLTAEDTALLLEAIAAGAAVSPAASRQMASLMQSETLDNGLAAGLPRGTTLAHKTGNWSNATHDAGIVYAGFTTYVIVVLSDKDHETEVTSRLSKAAYEYFQDLYRAR